jgi:hypothetical protein
MIFRLAITILAGLSFSGAWADSVKLKGSELVPDSRHSTANGVQAQVRGMFSYGAAIYQFPVPPSADRIKAAVRFHGSGKALKVYVYNYGTAFDDPSVRNRRLAPNWRLWEEAGSGRLWESRSPARLYTTSSDGRTDYLGPNNTVKLLLYAEGGVPYISEARFDIEEVSLEYDLNQSLLPDIITSKDVWVEGGFLLARGLGRSRSKFDVPGYEALPRLTALRLAKVDAYRKLGDALKKIPPRGGAAAIPGSRVRSTRYLSGDEVEIILEVPLASLHSNR